MNDDSWFSSFFFFSSRRRHTRLQGDWSSDVCSSDLIGLVGQVAEPGELDETIRLIEAHVVNKSPHIMRLGLRAFAEQDGLGFDAAMEVLRGKMAEVLAKIGRASCREGG